MSRLSNPEYARALSLLKENGWGDEQIGNAFGITGQAIGAHRRRFGIPALRLDPKIDSEKALEMWRAKASDGDIARAFGVTQSGATRWRQRRGLEPNQPKTPPLDAGTKREIRKMVETGTSRRQISEELKVSTKTITRMRKSMRFPWMRRGGVTDRAVRAGILKDRQVMKQIEQAIGRDLPADVRSDAIGDMYLAVLSGRLAKELIFEKAATYRSRSFEINYGRYGDTSLDADRGGWSLGDYMEDEDALNFIDEIANDD